MEELNLIPIVEAETILHKTDVFGLVSLVEAFHGLQVQEGAVVGDLAREVKFGGLAVEGVAHGAVGAARVKDEGTELRGVRNVKVQLCNRVWSFHSLQIDVVAVGEAREAPLGSNSIKKQIAVRIETKIFIIDDAIVDLGVNLVHHGAISDAQFHLICAQSDTLCQEVGLDSLGSVRGFRGQ